MADFDERFSGTRDDDSDADVKAALASYNDPNKSMAERVGLISSYASEDQPSQSTQNRRLSPQSTDIAQLPPVMPPNLQNMPDPRQYGMGPNQQQESPFKVFFNPMVLLGAASSLLTRRPLMAAMNYATGAMNGFQQGQNDVFEQNQAKFKDALAQAVAQNKVEIDRYNAAWDQRSQLTSENTAKLYTAASQNNDPAMQAAIKAQNWPLVEKLIQMKAQADEHIRTAEATAKIRAGTGLELKPETLDFLARQGLTGNQRILMGWYRFPAARAAIEERMREILETEQGITGQEAAEQVARNSASINALQQGAGVLGRREAMVTGAILTAQRTGPRVLEALRGVDRTKYPDLNKLIRAAATGTGSPEEIRLGIAVNTFINNYARASSSITGMTTDTARQEAQGLLQPYWATGQVEAGIDQMLNRELPSELEAAQESVQTFTGQFRTGGPQQAPTGAGPKEGDRKQFKQGWGVFKNGQWVPENAQ